jgi:putative ABC transport system substrate-binding protein
MKRREFIAGLGASATWPLAARAQQSGKLPTIGFLGTGTPSAMNQWVLAFLERLRELGWIEGRTVAIEYRWAEGHSERYDEIAAEFIRLKVDVIFTTVPAVATLKQATSVIPIVFCIRDRPSRRRLGREPGASGRQCHGAVNAGDRSCRQAYRTFGRSGSPPEAARRLRQCRHSPQVVLEMQEVDVAAQKLGLQVTTLAIRRADDIGPAFETLKGHAEALYVCADPLSVVSRV